MMKKVLYIAVIVLCITQTVKSQVATDAFRNSQHLYSGSARFTAMGGSMGALGGDLSAITVNPAGLGVYRSGEFNFTPVVRLNNYETDYSITHSNPYPDFLSFYPAEGSQKTFNDFDYEFKLNQIGFVTGFTRNRDEGWVSVNFSIGYNNLADFNRNYNAQYQGLEYTLLDILYEDEFAGFSQTIHDLAFDASLLYYRNDTLYSTIPAGEFISQDIYRNYSSSGRLGEYTIAIGANYSHMLYLGGSIGIQVVDYKERSDYIEEDNTDAVFPFDAMEYREELNYDGVGTNLKLGLIYRPINWVRLGLSFHSPTLFSLEEEYSVGMSSFLEYSDYDGETIEDNFPPFEYNLKTPYRIITSTGIQFGKMGVINIDYEFVDYKNMVLTADTRSFDAENEEIENTQAIAHNIRVGGELMLGNMALRGGYAYYDSGYNNDEDNADSDYNIISGGIGFRGKSFYVDATYSYLMNEMTSYFVGVDRSVLEKKQGRLMATVGFRF